MQLLGKFKQILYMGFRATLNFRKFKVPLNSMYGIYFNFTKSCISSCLSKFYNKKKFYRAVIGFQSPLCRWILLFQFSNNFVDTCLKLQEKRWLKASTAVDLNHSTKILSKWTICCWGQYWNQDKKDFLKLQNCIIPDLCFLLRGIFFFSLMKRQQPGNVWTLLSFGA